MYGIREAKGGFVLLDVLLAVIVISVALVALTGALTTALRADRQNEQLRTAANLAQSRLAEMKEYDGKGYARTAAVWNPSPVVAEQYTVRVGLLAAQDVPRDVQANLNIVPLQAIVSWNDGSEAREYRCGAYYLVTPQY